MRCPSINELPPPPSDKNGWPWSEENQSISIETLDISTYPKISIITPNYNYGHFLEETIRSILLQGYPNLEYIVIDGGSNDNSVEIIKKYEKWVNYWVSEKDKGQVNAINKGLKKCTGEIFNWINSDDQLMPGALYIIASLYQKNQQPDIVAGSGMGVDAQSRRILSEVQPKVIKTAWDLIKYGQVKLGISQSNAFLKRALIPNIVSLREDFDYCFDWILYLECLLNLGNKFKMVTTSFPISRCLVHAEAKTVKSGYLFTEEGNRFLEENYHRFSLWEKWQLKMIFMQKKSQDKVNQVMFKTTGINEIVLLLFQYPPIWASRFFWGALRRRLLLVIINSRFANLILKSGNR